MDVINKFRICLMCQDFIVRVYIRGLRVRFLRS